jgi:hypothetical protein
MSQERKTVYMSIFNAGEHDDYGWPPKNAIRFIAWFQEKIDSIPLEFRDSAIVEINSVSEYYGAHSVELEIHYKRPETDIEMRARIVRDKAAADFKASQQEQQERAVLAALQAKYGKASA